MTPSEEARAFIIERTLLDPESGCWLWTNKLHKSGYGKLQKDGAYWQAHRYSYHHLVAYLHKTDVVHHACANRACVNPEHLQALTPAENSAEMHERQAYRRAIVDLQDEVASLNEQLEHLYDQLEQGQHL